MRHVDPETLSLLALGEDAGSAGDQAHLQTCFRCSTTLSELTDAAVVGRSLLSVGPLDEPAGRVWDAIRTDLGLSDDPIIPPSGRHVPARLARRRRARLIAWVAIVATASIVATALGLWALRTSEPRTVASATLDAFPAWPGASGSAVVDQLSNGARVVSVHLRATPQPHAYREVWLITSDTKRLVSLGTLKGANGVFAVPVGTSLRDFTVVDISEEPRDGNPSHSGNSIVRGTLKR